MSIKETKRKAFNFFRSYFDVYNELPNEEDKLKFIDALLNKQFLGIEPDLDGIVKFAYISQKHNIDSQVKGYESKTGNTLEAPCLPPVNTPTEGGNNTPNLQEEGKGKGKEEVEYTILSFENFWDMYGKKKGSKSKCKKKFEKLSEEVREKIFYTLPTFLAEIKDIQFIPFPETYLNQERWNDVLETKKINATKKERVTNFDDSEW